MSGMAKRSEGWRGVAAFVGMIVLLYVAMGVTLLAQLSLHYGFWTAVTRPFYPVQTKPVIVLANGDVLSELDSFLHFLFSAVLWLFLVWLNVGWVTRWLKDR
jgi:hypothetical protein